MRLRRDISRDDVKGWLGSIVFHLCLALALLLWHIDMTTSEPESIEVSWGSIAAVPDVSASRSTRPGTEGHVATPQAPSIRASDLPERVLNTGDDVLAMPRGNKLDVGDERSTNEKIVPDALRGAKDRQPGAGIGEGRDPLSRGAGDLPGDVTDPGLSGVSGSDVGSAVSVSMLWSDGGHRKKIGGELPEYPPGVNVGAQIILDAIVTPDGSVKSVKPAQKGNTALEESGMKAVRLWKFEPLRRSSPQHDQHCNITFNFSLR